MDNSNTEKQANEEKLFTNLPMQLNLGDFEIRSHVGWADAVRNLDSGETHIHIRLSEEASQQLTDLVEVFNLKAIGFAGIKR